MSKWNTPVVMELAINSTETVYYETEAMYLEFSGVKKYYYIDSLGKRVYVDSIPSGNGLS